MGILRTWQDLPKETLLKAFEAGNFAGVEEMKRSDRLFERVAPMGVNDIMMAVQYRWAYMQGRNCRWHTALFLRLPLPLAAHHHHH